VASLELLSAVNLRDVRTLDDVADELGVDPAEAAEELAAAELEGFVVWEADESRDVPPDFDRRFVLLTQAGHVELYRLQDAVDSE
jgi:DNA-binding MarR family transcriptional regulator